MPPGYTSLSSLRGMLSARGKPFNELTYEEIIDNGMAVVGSPDTVGERFEAMIDELGFGQIISLMGVGDMPHYRTVKSMELYATQVMPALRRRSSRGAGPPPRLSALTASVMCPVGRPAGRSAARRAANRGAMIDAAIFALLIGAIARPCPGGAATA